MNPVTVARATRQYRPSAARTGYLPPFPLPGAGRCAPPLNSGRPPPPPCAGAWWGACEGGGGACLYTGSPLGASCLWGAGVEPPPLPLPPPSPLGRHEGCVYERSRTSPGLL